MHLGILAVNASDEFNAFSTPATRVRRPPNGYRWSAPGHVFGEVIAVGMSETRSEQKYSYKNYFEIRRENQDYGCQNISMLQLPLDLTPIGTKTTNRTTAPIDSIPI